MKEVFRHSDAGLVGMYQSLLEGAGIQTYVRNANTQQSLVGGLLTAVFPLPEFWPALCVVKDEEYSAAMEILNDVAKAGEKGLPEWSCPECGETVPGHFAVCWHCGHAAGTEGNEGGDPSDRGGGYG